jgi:hypothetical protein
VLHVALVVVGHLENEEEVGKRLGHVVPSIQNAARYAPRVRGNAPLRAPNSPGAGDSGRHAVHRFFSWVHESIQAARVARDIIRSST